MLSSTLRIPNQVVREGLYGDDHADANVLIIDGRGHELVDSLVAGAGELGEELAVEEEEAAEHFGNGKTPNGMADVFQKLLLQKSCEGRRRGHPRSRHSSGRQDRAGSDSSRPRRWPDRKSNRVRPPMGVRSREVEGLTGRRYRRIEVNFSILEKPK